MVVRDYHNIYLGLKWKHCFSIFITMHRCVMTTVDPEKGTKREDGEPLKTLQR